MTQAKGLKTQRLAWLEGIRIFAAVVLLLYHAQLLVTKYSYTPQPTGLVANMQQLFAAAGQLGDRWFLQVLSLPSWFGFQFVDVFVLISGFSLVLSLKGKPLELGSFIRRRFLRILTPFWAVAWLSYPVLWLVGTLTQSYIPDAWHAFASMTFPMLFDYNGDLLLPTNGPWWFVPLILSFALIFPLLWRLLHRWGTRNLLIASLVITFVYRALAVSVFGGHPTYAIVSAPAGWQPFVPFIAKLNTFVLGMIVARWYSQGKGPVFWTAQRSLSVGIVTYAIGFGCQFYRFGWIFNDFLLAIGLTLILMVVFRFLSERLRLAGLMTLLGLHSYSYFLIHNFVVDRTINLVVQQNLSMYYVTLPLMIVGTLALAFITDAITPKLQALAIAAWNISDALLTPVAKLESIGWTPQVGDRVCYGKQQDWTITKVQQVIHDKAFYLCRITNGKKTLWVNQNDLTIDPKFQKASLNHSS